MHTSPTQQAWGVTALRVIVGVVFLVHGLQKMFVTGMTGLTYRFNDWVGLSADYRTFFVHREGSTPRVNRFTTGLTLSLK